MNQHTNLKIGITGGIGAGKSTVAKVFSALGIPIYDADTRAKWLMNNDQKLVRSIQSLFGREAYTSGSLNRELLGKVAFSNPEKLMELNALVHPHVATDYAEWARKNAQHPYTLKEAALLFESGSYKQLHAVIYVAAPEPLRIKRVLGRDPHRSENDIKEIIKRQWPEERKIKLADHVIQNDASARVIPQVLALHRLFLDKISR